MRPTRTDDELRARYELRGRVTGTTEWRNIGYPYCERDSAAQDARRFVFQYAQLRIVDLLSMQVIETFG